MVEFPFCATIMAMKDLIAELKTGSFWFTLISMLAVGGIFAYGSYQYVLLDKENVTHKKAITQLEASLFTTTDNNSKLNQALQEAQATVEDFGKKVSDISSTVGTLEKLSQTDKQLLEKYSKVYFLNEHYVPADLVEIDEQYLSNKKTAQKIQGQVSSYLNRLLESANDDDIKLQVASGYRSFTAQASLKSQYKVIYGAGTANQFSADQGYSEHQLGTTVDFTTVKTGPGLVGFEKDPAYTWLVENAHKYGFILSYPKGNAYYKYEPWHWRFVGVDLARMLYSEKKNFYDLDQREIDKYLISLFD